eukprot:491822-Pelagomonas_calceolata.AAC.1
MVPQPVQEWNRAHVENKCWLDLCTLSVGTDWCIRTSSEALSKLCEKVIASPKAAHACNNCKFSLHLLWPDLMMEIPKTSAKSLAVT